jgi:type VI protein secretion system component Hcp
MATDAFLKIESTTGVFLNGESQVVGDVNESEVVAWNWGDQTTVSLSNLGYSAGKPVVQPLDVTLYMSSASATLLKALNTGTVLKSLKLTVRKGGAVSPFEFLYIEGTGIIVTGYAVGGGSGIDRLAENWTFQLSTVKYTYRSQKLDGTLASTFITTYDLRTGIAG